MCTGVSITSTTINCLRQIQASAVPKMAKLCSRGEWQRCTTLSWHLEHADFDNVKLCGNKKCMSKYKIYGKLRVRDEKPIHVQHERCENVSDSKKLNLTTQRQSERKRPSFPLSNLSVWSSLPLSLEREKQSDSQSDTLTMSPQAGRAKTITLIP